MPFAFEGIEKQTDASLLISFMRQVQGFLSDCIDSNGEFGYKVRFVEGIQTYLVKAWNDSSASFQQVLDAMRTDQSNELKSLFPAREEVGMSGVQLRAKLLLLERWSVRIKEILDLAGRGWGKILDILERAVEKIFDIVNSILGSLIAATAGTPGSGGLEAIKEIKELIHHAIDVVFPKPV